MKQRAEKRRLRGGGEEAGPFKQRRGAELPAAQVKLSTNQPGAYHLWTHDLLMQAPQKKSAAARSGAKTSSLFRNNPLIPQVLRYASSALIGSAV